MASILQKILEAKKDEVARAKKYRSMISLRDEVENDSEIKQDLRRFESALRTKIQQKKAGVIAEVKKASPSKGVIRHAFYPDRISESYEQHGAACLSVLTDKTFFQGSLEDLQLARKHCRLPVLRKDFIIDFYQIYEARFWRSDAVLLIVGALDQGLMMELESCAQELGMNVLLEVHDQFELERALRLKTQLIGINNRNLKTFETSIQNTLDLRDHIPPEKLIVAESGIAEKADVAKLMDAGIEAFLVGEAFMRAPLPGEALAKLFEGAL